MAEGQTISSENRIVELLELFTNNQMNAQAEQVKQLCGYVAKRKDQRALYKITQVTGMRKKLVAIKDKVDGAIDRVESLEKAVEECYGQQERADRRKLRYRALRWQNRRWNMVRNCLSSIRGSMVRSK